MLQGTGGKNHENAVSCSQLGQKCSATIATALQGKREGKEREKCGKK